eukprot:9727631-Lingulodinium_polyedra.AAC.1
MTGGWIYKLRLFNEEETSQWETILKKNGNEEDYVGAQWSTEKPKSKPPENLDENVKYRPISLFKVQ